MKISFVSGYFNHHQKPLGDALYRLTDGKFRFVSTTEMPSERLRLGYTVDAPEYVEKLEESDVAASDVIVGGVNLPDDLKKKLGKNSLYFRYSERLFKKGSEPLKYAARFVRQRKVLPKIPSYLLCASAYVYSDMRSLGLFKNRAYKWGYFPETRRYEDLGALLSKKDKTEILWCGRFLWWKHPDDLLAAAAKLKADGTDFKIKFVGVGETEEKLRLETEKYGLEDNVVFCDGMSPDEVRSQMERAGIFAFTSDFNEGWGAVLNEAMNSGCAVVASHAAGSTPYLVEDGKDGFIYKSCDVNGLYERLKTLLNSPSLQEDFGRAAYEKIVSEWNSDVAAERFVALCREILSGNKTPDLYESGPCSKAEKLKNDWYEL